MSNRRDQPDRPVSLARSLGLFLGHILRGFKADSTQRDPARSVRRSTTDQHSTTDASGDRVTLRRTVIEEIEIDRPAEANDHETRP